MESVIFRWNLYKKGTRQWIVAEIHFLEDYANIKREININTREKNKKVCFSGAGRKGIFLKKGAIKYVCTNTKMDSY